jgi:oxygen-independent coproporphyrinogen-3 oxidase
MHIMANEFFNELKYTQRPVWWFTKTPNDVYRQQIHKWSDLGEQIALGVSGYSFINDIQYFNYRTVPQYLEKIKNGELPIWKGIKLSKDDLMRRLILFGLKTGLSKNLFESKFGKNPKSIFKDTWTKLENLGLIEDGELIQLSYKGKLFADEIAKEFFSDKIKESLVD